VYQRLLLPPAKGTFFLFGPRGTGKSTWLAQHFASPALRIDLLRSAELMKYQRSPSLLRDEVMALPRGARVVIDEVQKLPVLLDEVHALLFERGSEVSFALSGSSARKLRKTDANLLAGRALTRKLSVLSCLETGAEFRLDQALRFGMLPAVVNEPDVASRTDRLDAYVETYLKEEIQQEALVRNLDSFFRFLQVAALFSGQILNISGVARDVGVSRSTVQGYFDILVDTLVGWYLPAFRLRAKVKEIAHPKFYFFDVGVQRAVGGEHRNKASAAELGHLFEAYVLNEIRMLTAYRGIGAELSYWRTEAGTEVDLIWHRGTARIGFEIKHKETWTPRDSAGLETLLDERKVARAFGIYKGSHRLKQGRVTIFPVFDALAAIGSGEIGFE
jgi:predicted AAA+ superfamily ATPase